MFDPLLYTLKGLSDCDEDQNLVSASVEAMCQGSGQLSMPVQYAVLIRTICVESRAFLHLAIFTDCSCLWFMSNSQ